MRTNRPATNPRSLARLSPHAMAMALASVVGLAAPAGADSVRLRDKATCPGPKVVLAQVATLEGPEAQALADMTVADLAPGGAATITLDSVRLAMARRNVHWGRVSLGGFAQCSIVPPVSVTSEVSPANLDASGPSPVLANPAAAVEASASTTLRDRLTEALATLASLPVADLRVTLSPADLRTLAGIDMVASDRFEFEPQSATGLGRVPVMIRRWRSGRTAESFRVTPEVTRRVKAVVVVSAIARGEAIDVADVELQDCHTAQASTAHFNDVSRVVGQTSVTALKPGTIVGEQHLRSPVVVRRGDLLTVRCVAGALVVKTVARATQDAAVGEVISARNERSRDAAGALSVRITGPGEAVVDAGLASTTSAVIGAQAPAALPRTGGSKP